MTLENIRGGGSLSEANRVKGGKGVRDRPRSQGTQIKDINFKISKFFFHVNEN